MQEKDAASLLFRAGDIADTLCSSLIVVTAISLCLTVACQVFARYVLNASLFWSEELGRMLLSWLTFLGAASAYKAKAHIGIDSAVAVLPPPYRRLMRIAVHVVSLAFFLAMAFYGTRYCLFSMSLSTTTLGVSKAVPFIMLPIGGALMTLHAVVFLIEECRRPEA